ncbi:MAG: urea ABC transporter substrate-binding protein [Elusimicrobia bacterium]|nr:urea ABC transporter substrate-binding protein [Elusimicrobiota bacterium]
MTFKTLLLIAAAGAQLACKAAFHPPIKVGILHSLSGTMAASEKPVADAVLLAVDEVNKSGGVLGRKLEPVVADGRSDPDVFQREAERLITQEHVAVIFGCWTSASRKAVKPIVEKYHSLLLYPVQSEGLEQSPNIVYLGAAPNQQLIPALVWAREHLGKRFFLVGSDYVFPRMANAIAKDVLRYIGGQVVGEDYVLLGGTDFAGIAEAIKKAKPDVVLNTVNGDSNISLFEALHDAELPSSKIAIFSLSLDENGISSIQEHFQAARPQEAAHFIKQHLAGTYACWNYFESIDTPLNADFIDKFKKEYGKNRRVTDPMEAAYIGVRLWSQAVNESGNADDVQELLGHLKLITMPAPEGVISIDDNLHARKTTRIGRLNDAGAFDVLWTSKGSVIPVPYPDFRDKAYWEGLLDRLYRRWNGHWAAAPGNGA